MEMSDVATVTVMARASQVLLLLLLWLSRFSRV